MKKAFFALALASIFPFSAFAGIPTVKVCVDPGGSNHLTFTASAPKGKCIDAGVYTTIGKWTDNKGVYSSHVSTVETHPSRVSCNKYEPSQLGLEFANEWRANLYFSEIAEFQRKGIHLVPFAFWNHVNGESDQECVPIRFVVKQDSNILFDKTLSTDDGPVPCEIRNLLELDFDFSLNCRN
jgi:hypothetical protein